MAVLHLWFKYTQEQLIRLFAVTSATLTSSAFDRIMPIAIL